MKRVEPMLFGTALLASLVTGCARDVAPTDAPQGAYEVTVGFTTALKAANAYAALPRCAAAVVHPCSDQAMVKKVSDEAEKAHNAVLALQDVARNTKSSESDTQQAISAAHRAIFVLQATIPHS